MDLTLERRQLVRYSAIGIGSNLLCYLIYLCLTQLGLSPKLAMTGVYCLGVLQSFFLNKRWTFAYNGGNRRALYRYCVCYAIGYFCNLVALYLFVDVFAYPHQLVQAVLIVLIAAMLFLAQKLWVFRAD